MASWHQLSDLRRRNSCVFAYSAPLNDPCFASSGIEAPGERDFDRFRELDDFGVMERDIRSLTDPDVGPHFHGHDAISEYEAISPGILQTRIV